MLAILATSLIALAAVAALGALADSGLRWWSAFGRLRAELRGELAIQQPLAMLRPCHSLSGIAGAERARAVRVSSPGRHAA